MAKGVPKGEVALELLTDVEERSEVMRRFMQDLLFMSAIGVGALWTTQQAVRRSRWFEFAGKSAIVTGGSRGLGLVIARELVSVGA